MRSSAKLTTIPISGLKTALYFAGSVVTAMILGTFVEWLLIAWGFERFTWEEPLFPWMLIPAGILGIVAVRLWGDHEAAWTWVLGFLWLVVGACLLASDWQESPGDTRTRFAYVAANLFGPTDNCSADTECLYTVIFTAPLMCSIAFSAISLLGLRSRNTERFINQVQYSRLLLITGSILAIIGSSALFLIGRSGPLIMWLYRGVAAVPLVIGALLVVNQLQLRNRIQRSSS